MGVTTAWTTVRETFLIAASRAAQHTAAFDAGEPSTATKMPSCLTGADISFSFSSGATLQAGAVIGREALVLNHRDKGLR